MLIPAIRFPQYTDEYEERPLSDFLEENKERNKENRYSKQDVKSVSGDFGVVNQIEFFGKSMAGSDVSDYHIVNHNDIVYTKSPLKANPYGIIKCNTGTAGIVSTLYAVYRSNKEVDPEYIDCYFGYDKRVNKYLLPLVNIGAKHDMKVNNQDAISGSVFFPSIEEQHRVVEVMRAYNKRILNQIAVVKALELRRKGLLQKVFSQEIRFKAADGSKYESWDELTIADLFTKVKTTNKDGLITNVITNSAVEGLIPQRDFFEKDIAVEGNTNTYTVIHQGDFVYNPRKSTSAPYGPFNCYQMDAPGIVSPLYSCLKPKKEQYTPYLLYYFRSPVWYSYIYNNGNQGGARHDRVGMTDDLLMGIPVSIPCMEEQKKITSFFSLIDAQIQVEKDKLEAVKLVKKGLLQQMFV